MFVINTRRFNWNNVYQGNHYLPQERRTNFLLWKNSRCSLIKAKHIPLHHWLTSGGGYESTKNLFQLARYSVGIGRCEQPSEGSRWVERMHGLVAKGPNSGVGDFGTFVRSCTLLNQCCMLTTNIENFTTFYPTFCACHTMWTWFPSKGSDTNRENLEPRSICKVPKARTPRKQQQMRHCHTLLSSMRMWHLIGSDEGKHFPTFALYIMKPFCSWRIEQTFTTTWHGTFHLLSLFHTANIIVTSLNLSLSSFSLSTWIRTWCVLFRWCQYERWHFGCYLLRTASNIHDCLVRVQTSMVQLTTSSMLSCANPRYDFAFGLNELRVIFLNCVWLKEAILVRSKHRERDAAVYGRSCVWACENWALWVEIQPGVMQELSRCTTRVHNSCTISFVETSHSKLGRESLTSMLVYVSFLQRGEAIASFHVLRIALVHSWLLSSRLWQVIPQSTTRILGGMSSNLQPIYLPLSSGIDSHVCQVLYLFSLREFNLCHVTNENETAKLDMVLQF